MEYKEQEWTTMLFAPLWVFEAVAGADGKVDDEEWDALYDAIKQARKFRNDLSRDIFTDLKEEYEDLLDEYEDDDTGWEDGLAEVAKLVQKYEDTPTRFGFKADMIALAVEVARVSGGWLGGRISGEERRAMKLVARALDLPPEDFNDILEDLNAK